jgi:ATP-binding cassette, subfamily B, bacterial
MSSYTVVHPVVRIVRLLQLDKVDITSLYFYAILSGLIQLTLPLGVQAIINFVMFNTLSTSLVILVALVILGVFFSGLVQVKQMEITEKVQQKIFVRYAFAFADKLPKIEQKGTENYSLPELTNRFFDTINLQKGLSKLLLDVPMASIQILFGVILLSFYHPVFIALGVLLLLIVYLILRLTSHKGLQTSFDESDYKYKVAAWLQEVAQHISVFKNYRSTAFNITKTDAFTREYLKNRTKHFKILRIQYWSLIVFKVLLTAAMLIIGCVLLLNQLINIGQFIAAEIVILSITASIEKLIVSIDVIFDVLTASEKLNKLLQKPEEPSGNLQLNVSNPLSISFQDVCFSYTPQLPVIRHASFEIKAGEKILLNRSESKTGTSTLLKMLANYHSPSSGIILINGIPENNYNLESYQKHISYLTGQNEIFSGTLWENITLGNKQIKPEQVIELVEKLGFESFIQNFEEGYNTPIQNHGILLSSYLIKNILLLRTLLQPHQLLLLDEPFMNLTKATQLKVAEYVTALPSTVIVATQNIDLERYFDRSLRLGSSK